MMSLPVVDNNAPRQHPPGQHHPTDRSGPQTTPHFGQHPFGQCTDRGCTAEVNCEVHVQTEMAAAPGQFIALQAINVVKEIISDKVLHYVHA